MPMRVKLSPTLSGFLVRPEERLAALNGQISTTCVQRVQYYHIELGSPPRNEGVFKQAHRRDHGGATQIASSPNIADRVLLPLSIPNVY